MKVTVSPERISLRPGESADVELTIQNASQVVEHFSASVVGLPGNDLFTCEPDVVKLRPKEVGTLRLKVDVPERGGMIAGPYILGVVVKSPYSQEVSRCEELPLDVRPAPSLTMGVQPEVVTGGKVGSYVVNLANEGNMPMAVTLQGSDPENRVGFKFEPRELRLEPGTVAGAQVTVNSDPPLTGQEIRRSITLRANAGETTVERPVTFVQRPRIRGGWMKFGALAAGLAVLGGATVGGAMLLRDIKADNVAQTSPLQPPQAPNANDTNANPAPGQGTPPSAPPSQPPSQPPQQSTPPPQSTPQVPGVAQVVPTNQLVDFTDNKGQPAQEGPVDSDRYADLGIRLQNVTDKAPIDCRDATQQIIRIARPGNPKNPVSGAGAFLTSSRPLNPTACSIVPIQINFFKPLSAVNVFFTALPGVKYTAVVTFEDGNIQLLEAAGTQIGVDVGMGLTVPPNGKPIKSVTFGHSPSVPDSQQSVVMLKKLGYTTVN
ncbi:MAG: hypothetical protein ABW215_02965 [Kibdelosporangium sp.]